MKNGDIEKFILTELVQNEDYTRSAIPYIKKDYFSNDVYKKVFESISSHFDTYNVLPTKDALSIDITNSALLFEKDFDRASELVDDIYDSKNKSVQKLEWEIDVTEKWCKQRAIYNAILESASIIDPSNKSAKKKPFTAIESIVRDALSVSFNNNVGHDYFMDSDARFDFYHSKEERIPFAIDDFNEITGGGLPNKTLNLVLAGVHVGKSAFMCDYAANCLKQGKKVLYITCEMAEERIAERIDANILDTQIQDLKTLSKGMYGGLISKAKAAYKGCLKIKEYPTGNANVSHFRALLNELSMKQNFVPDVLVIDYLNICSSMRYSGDVSNSYGYVKTIAEEIRGLAIEFEIPILSACQVNRSSYSNSDYDMDGIAESFGISATADFMFALISTEALEKHGLLCVKQLKNRYDDSSKKKRFVVCVNKPKMQFSQADAAAQALLATGSAGIVPAAASAPMPGGGYSSSGGITPKPKLKPGFDSSGGLKI